MNQLMFIFTSTLYKMRISAVQFHIDYQDEEAAWARTEDFMRKSSLDRVDLIIFPKYFIAGYKEDMKEQDPLGGFVN